jgi:ribosomal protein S12 methylthiotransferase
MTTTEPAGAPTAAIVTLGCGRNEVDSENAAGLLAAAGYRVVDDPEQADAVLVNTCAFIEAAKRESIDTVLDAAALKREGRARKVLVMGCLAERYTEELRAELPEADAVVPFADYGRLPELLGGAGPAGAVRAAGAAPAAGAPLVPPGRRALPMVFPTPPAAAFPARAPARAPVAMVKLAEGCDRDCSFCAIPSFRGPFRSRRPTEVLAEVAWLAAQGVSEVCLVAENSTSYGKDLGGREALVRLLRDLAGVEGLRRVRLNYLQPDELTPGLLEEMAANPVVCSYFDLSLQHASAPVLRRMRRGGSREAFLDLVARIRALDPDAAFRSNFILGFSPGRRRTAPPRSPWTTACRRVPPAPGSSGCRRCRTASSARSRPAGSAASWRCWSSAWRTAPPRAAASARASTATAWSGSRAAGPGWGSTCGWWSPPPRAPSWSPARRPAATRAPGPDPAR